MNLQKWSSLKNNIVINYFENYYITAKDWGNIKERLELVFEVLTNVNFTLRSSKCQFVTKQIVIWRRNQTWNTQYGSN